MGRGRIVFHTRLCLSGKKPSAKRLQDDNGKVPLHAHSASTGAPNLPVELEIRDPVGPLRGPPVRAGGQARLCRLASGRGRRLHWLGSPSQLGVEAATGHGLAESPLPRGRRCPVAHPWRKRNAELANPSQRPASRGSSASGRSPGPRCSPLPRPVGGRAEARAGSGSSRAPGKAWRGHDHGRRRVSGGSAGTGGEGLPRPAKAQGSRPPAAPVGAGADHWQPVRLPSSDGALVSFSPVHAGSVARPEPTRVRLAVHLLVAHTEPPPGSQAPVPRLASPASATSRTQRRQPQPPGKP